MIKLTATQLDRLISIIPIGTFFQINYEVNNTSSLSDIEFDVLAIFLKHHTSLSYSQLGAIIQLEMGKTVAVSNEVGEAIRSLLKQNIIAFDGINLTFRATRRNLLSTSTALSGEESESETEQHLQTLATLSEELKKQRESLKIMQLLNGEKYGSLQDLLASDTRATRLPPNRLPFFSRPSPSASALPMPSIEMLTPPASALPPPGFTLLAPDPSTLPIPNFGQNNHVTEPSQLDSGEIQPMQSRFAMGRYK